MANGGGTETVDTTSVNTESLSYEDRLKTFDHTWTGAKTGTEIATAGFWRQGGMSELWTEAAELDSTDNPLHEHAKRRQLCPFINSTYKQLRLNKPPKHPQYQELQDRLDSFVGWPARYVPKTAEELSAAGFFYIGSADRVTCFQCGITLRDWEEEHDPVGEHRRYSEHCQLINNTDLDQLGVNARNISSQNKPEENEKRVKAGDIHTKNDPNSQPLPAEQTGSIDSKKSQKSMVTDFQELTLNCRANQSSVSSQLSEENKRLREKRQCKICQKKSAAMLFLPCGHLVTCVDCASKVTDCALCGKTILATVRTYFS